MPGLLIVALVGSLLIHGAALLGTEVAWFDEPPEAPVIHAVLQVPPAPAAVPAATPPPARRAARAKPLPRPTPPPAPIAEKALPVVPEEVVPPAAEAVAATEPEPAAAPSPEPVKPALPANGVIRFSVVKDSLGLEVGRAEQRWEFGDDGTYRLTASSETSGLAAMFSPARLDQESRGRLVAGGLQPESFRSLREGKPQEGADFDWPAGVLRMLRDGSTHPLRPGTQDILSLLYQLAYLAHLADGVTLGVVTARKFERHALDALGEEEIETPAGRFRTLRLRAISETMTEIWIALDHGRLPVKIRFTDKKGESFEQVATELGSQ